MRGIFPIVALLLTVVAAAVKQDEGGFTFSHKMHIDDVGLECLDCHTAAAEEGVKSSHPKMETCSQCHEEQIEEKNCGMCHSKDEGPGHIEHTLHHPGFSHKDHLDRGVKCQLCHEGMSTAETITGDKTPDMAVCFTCHNDKKAPQNCNVCHTETRDIMPASHRLPEFKTKDHGSNARYGREQCNTCHQERYCDRCHRGKLSTEPHPVNFRYTHGFDARRRAKECRTCHEQVRFCTQCHEGRR